MCNTSLFKEKYTLPILFRCGFATPVLPIFRTNLSYPDRSASQRTCGEREEEDSTSFLITQGGWNGLP